MKKGDVVTVEDGSYSRSVIDGKSIHETKTLYGKQYRVVETGCKFPVIDPLQPKYEYQPTFNNTVIQAIDSGKVIFIEERFLKLVLPTHKVMVDIVPFGVDIRGNVIEISDELYRQIKK